VRVLVGENQEEMEREALTPLLPPEQYYRPTRTRELREQAAQLRSRANDLRNVGALVAGCACLLLIPGFCIAPLTAMLFLLLFSVVAEGMLMWIASISLERRALACEREAETLEREHQARYGTTGPLLATSTQERPAPLGNGGSVSGSERESC
jgi:hypothetical protein